MTSAVKCLSLFNNDTAKGDIVDVAADLTEFQEIQSHIKRKHPYYDNYYEAKDVIMEVMEKRQDIVAGLIQRKKNNTCAVYFRTNKAGESTYQAFLRFVDEIKPSKDVDLFIKIVCD